MPRILRENYNEGWSRWVQAMVPSQPLGEDYETRGDGQKGLMRKNIRNVLPDEMKNVVFMNGRPEEHSKVSQARWWFMLAALVERNAEPCEEEFSSIA